MSFPRARTKRFNDVVSDAPSPTAYDPKLDVPPIGPASFYRGPRFRQSAAADSGSGGGVGSSEDCSIVGGASLASTAASGHGSAPRVALGRSSSVASGRASSRSSTVTRLVTPGRGRGRRGAGSASGSSFPHDQARQPSNADSQEQHQDESPSSSEAVAQVLRELDLARSAAARDRAQLVVELEQLRATLAIRDAELRESRSSADASERALAVSVDSSRTCIGSLTEQLSTVKAACELIERREADARCQIESLQGLLNGERLRAEREMDSLRTKLGVVIARCAQSDLTTAEPVGSDHCTRALQEYRAALEEENQELQQDLRQMEELRHHDCDTIRALKGELFAADDYRRQAEEELLSLRRDLTDLCANVEVLQESGIAAERALLSSREKCESLQGSLAAAEEAKEQALSDLGVARSVLADALEQCKTADESLVLSQEAGAAVQRKLLAEGDELRAQLVELTQRVSIEADRRRQQLQAAVDARDGDVAELTRQLAAAREAAAAEQSLAAATIERLRSELAEASLEPSQPLDGMAAAPREARQHARGGIDTSAVAEAAVVEDGAACIVASTSERHIMETAGRHISVSMLEDCASSPLQSSGGCSADNHAMSAEQLAGAERRASELELKLAETEADINRLKADYDSRLAASHEASAASAAESKYWKDLYEELHTKVEPFLEQLDAYELERHALLSRSQHRADELAALSTAYAKLLGHQNQRQKIQHVVKIKDENRSLKRELETLREEKEKLKRVVSAKDDKIRALEGRRRFDTTQAFKHSLDTSMTNSSTSNSILKTPLKDCSNSVRGHKP